MVSIAGSLQFPKGSPSPVKPPGMSVLASTAKVGWRGFHGAILEGRLSDFFYHSAPDHFVSFSLTGASQVEWKRGGRHAKYHSRPGEVTVIPAGEDNYFRFDRSTEAFHWLIDADRLQELAEREWTLRGSRIEIIDTWKKRDAKLWPLGQRLAAHLRSPIPGSRLFAEALHTQISIQLLWDHSSLCRPSAPQVERLTDARLARVIDYIHSYLGHEISLSDLAEVAGLSPHYFLDAFKRATGRTPHRYLTERRIAKACELLRNPHRSILDVTLAVGFSSQSHMTAVFRRFMKTTPASYRNEALGSRRVADDLES
jgi:AraC family transcriptional regulator